MMRKTSLALLFLAFTLISCSDFGESQEFSLDTDEPRDFFLGLGDGGDNDHTGEVTFSFGLFDTSSIVESVQEIIEPINEKIESVGQQIDNAFAWIGDGVQDVIETIQKPIDQHIDTVLTWVGGEETKNKMTINNENGEESFSLDETYYMTAKKSLEEEEEGEEIVVFVELPNEIEEEDDEIVVFVDLSTEIEEEDDEIVVFVDLPDDIAAGGSFGEEGESMGEDTIFEDGVVIIEEVQPTIYEIPVSTPIEDIGEVLVLINYEDIITAMGVTNTTAEAIESEPFFVRFYEFFMGKEVELELKSAGLSPVEESNRKRQFLSYDAL